MEFLYVLIVGKEVIDLDSHIDGYSLHETFKNFQFLKLLSLLALSKS